MNDSLICLVNIKVPVTFHVGINNDGNGIVAESLFRSHWKQAPTSAMRRFPSYFLIIERIQASFTDGLMIVISG